MLPRLFSKTTAIGLDLQGSQFCAVRVKTDGRKVEVTHYLETPEFAALGRELEKADRVVTRPPPNTWFNRRAARVSGDWSKADKPTWKERGLEVFQIARRWTPMDMEQSLFGWQFLSYHSKTAQSEIEIHQSESGNCLDFKKTLETLKLGPVHIDAWHTTSLSCAIPPRFRSYLLESRSPDGYALVRNGSLIAHLSPAVFSPTVDPKHPDLERLKTFMKDHFASESQLQAYFLNKDHPTPRVPGLSCSWVGENARELTGVELSTGCLQALGLALSSQKEWWLHHISEFRPPPSPFEMIRSALRDLTGST